MRILFIYTEISNFDKQHYYLGLGSIIAMLEKHGHQCGLICLYDEVNRVDFTNTLSKYQFDLVGITSNWLQWKYVKQIVRWVKKYRNLPIICGGCMPTFETETVVSDENIDIVCVGYGEYAMLELVDRLDQGRQITDIDNLWVKSNGKIYKNRLRPLPNNLDDLPFPSRKHADYNRLLNKTDYTATISAGRGCIYNCAFCANASLRTLYLKKGKLINKHSPRYVVDEIKFLLESYPVKRLFFEDEDFVHTREWTTEFCDLYSKEVSIPFMVGYSISRANKDILEMLKNAGCEWVGYGVESGNEWMRMHILDKKVKNQEVINTFNLTKKIGLKPIATVMVGLPSETPETIKETIDFLYKIRPYFTIPLIYYPIPKTKLFELCKGMNIISDRVADNISEGDSVLDIPGISAKDFKDLYGQVCDANLDIMIKETDSGYLGLVEKIRSNKNIKIPDYIEITIDWWKNIFDNQPIINFVKSGLVELKIKIKRAYLHF